MPNPRRKNNDRSWRRSRMNRQAKSAKINLRHVLRHIPDCPMYSWGETRRRLNDRFTEFKRNLAMKFPMIQADDQGETSFGVREISDQEVPFGPPPNPTGLRTDFGAVESMFAFSVPAGTDVPAHNAPQPYICIILSGEGEVLTSDGDGCNRRSAGYAAIVNGV